MQLTVTSSPHIRGKDTTARMMRDVMIALMPTAAAGVFFYGLRALLVILTCVGAALAGEWLVQLMLRRQQTLFDGSAVVTGLLLAMTLPASAPYWLAAVGSLFAVAVMKGLCGGIGQNAFNPALAARALLLLVWPSYLTRYPMVGADMPLFGKVDVVSSATPLHEMQMFTLPETSLWDMFIGNVGGCIGEVSALALLAGGIYLMVRRVIYPRIPLAYLGSMAVLTLIFFRGDQPFLWMLYSLLGGGVMLGAMFMATDYSTSPVNPKGKILYGEGCGTLTVFFRYTGIFTECFTYAILLMNAAVWLIDELTPPRRFGTGKGVG